MLVLELPLTPPKGCANLRRHARHVGDLFIKDPAIVLRREAELTSNGCLGNYRIKNWWMRGVVRRQQDRTKFAFIAVKLHMGETCRVIWLAIFM